MGITNTRGYTMNIKQKAIMKSYMDFYSKNKKTPSLVDLKLLKISREDVRQNFNSLTELNEVARELYPTKFYDEAIVNILNKKDHGKKIEDWIKGYNKFIITTAVMGCTVNKKFLKAINLYCKKNNAKLLILTCSDPAKNGQADTIDKNLSENVLPYEVYLNDNLFVSSLKMSAKQIDPSRSVSRVGHDSGSVIYASPKQRLETSSTAPGNYPLVTMGTGAITNAEYDTDRYMSERTAYLADLDHVMGALVVEVQDKKIFHFRQIQAEKGGSFIDLNKKYSPDGKVTTIAGSALILGDWHSGSTDPTAIAAWKELSSLIKPKYLILHDTFDGSSISHHEISNKILRAKKAESNKLNLEEELKLVTKDLEMVSSWADKVILVASNHDDWISRYVKEGRFIEDPQNLRVAFKLGLAMLDGKNPFEYAIRDLYQCKAKNLKWLNINDSFKYGGHELGCHGHRGSNGTRGSLKSIEKALGACVVGHSHTPGILRKAKQVGTSTYLEMHYNDGPSSWLQTSCIINNNGSYQLITSVGGAWRLK